MSGSFQCDSPVSEYSGSVVSAFLMTDAHVASRSPPVRHRFAESAIHSPQPATEPQLSTLSTMGRPVLLRHASKPRLKRTYTQCHKA